MGVTKMNTTQEYVETRVHPPITTHELVAAIKEIERERDDYGTDPVEVIFEDSGVTLRFPTTYSSSGRD
jgi:hypothetical protein